MTRRSALLAIASLTLVVGVTRLAVNWLQSPVIRTGSVTRSESANSAAVDDPAPPDPAPVNRPAPSQAPEASRVESTSRAVVILDRAYGADSTVAQSAEALQRAVLDALLPLFREKNRVIAEEQEVVACGPSVKRILKGVALDGRDPERMGRSEQRAFNVSLVLEWKTERALFDAFGGPVTSDEFGRLTAVGARASYLKEQHAAGAFKINDPELAARFWSAVDASATAKDPAVTEVDFSTPWWSRRRR